MNVLNITMRPTYKQDNTAILIDGKRVYFKKKNGEYSYRHETENDSVELTIYRILEINGKLWFLFSLLYFFISALGIFDAHYDKRCYCLRYKTVLQLNGENNIKLEFNPFKEGGVAVKCTADCSAEQLENEYYVDKTAKKRLKTMRIVKLLIWLAAIAVAVTVTVLKITG